MERLHGLCGLAFVIALLAISGQSASAAFLESFTTNPEVTALNFNKAAPFLWVQLGKIEPGGRGPTDTANPAGGNALVISSDNPVDETVLMNWDTTNTTQITFHLFADIPSGCEPYTGMLKLLLSNDTRTWQQVWNRTVAQMVRNQYDPVRVALPMSLRPAPVAFKWVFTGTSCYGHAIWMDDITFPTVPPSADTLLMGKAPQAPLTLTNHLFST